MAIAWQRVLPVIISIAIIILVAVVQEYSKTLAAITATMPLTAPLALWIVYAGTGGDKASMNQFIEALFLSSIPFMVFLVGAWWAARQGWRIIPIMLAGYGSWAMSLAMILGLREVLGQ
jgi:hypothetical protein